MELEELISYERLSAATLPEAMDCLAGVFPAQEPITSHLGVTNTEFRPFALDLMRHSQANDLCWVALARRKVVGVRVATDFHRDFTPAKSYGEKMDRICAFLHAVASPAKGEIAREGPTVHSHMVAVLADYQGFGLARGLLQASSRGAQELGYVYAAGEVTNQRNRRILERIPSFSALHAVRYDEYEEAGTKPFTGIQNHDACVLFRFRLADC